MRERPAPPAFLPSALALAVALAIALAACDSGSPDPDPGAQGLGGTAGEPGDDEEEPGDDGGGTAGGTGDEAALGEGLTVAAPVYPLAWTAGQVAPGATVELLAGAGGDPHDIELSPRGRELMETADVVVYMGPIDYQPQVERAAREAGGQVVAFSEVVGEEALRPWDHDDDHAHDDDDHASDDHAHGALDPHAWFDARLMAEAATAVGAAFATADPDHADEYEARAQALAADFREAADDIAALFEGGCAHERVIVSHEAYAYLLGPHGLRQEGVSGVGGHGPASPQRIGELVRTVRDEGIGHVLAEPVEGREDAAAVADEAGVELLDVYSLEVVDDEGLFGERGFLELLREQALAAATALGCEPAQTGQAQPRQQAATE